MSCKVRDSRDDRAEVYSVYTAFCRDTSYKNRASGSALWSANESQAIAMHLQGAISPALTHDLLRSVIMRSRAAGLCINTLVNGTFFAKLALSGTLPFIDSVSDAIALAVRMGALICRAGCPDQG